MSHARPWPRRRNLWWPWLPAALLQMTALSVQALEARVRAGLEVDGEAWIGQQVILKIDLLTNALSFSGQRIHLPDVPGALVLVAALGGYDLFGFFGVIYGPVLMVLVMTTIERSSVRIRVERRPISSTVPVMSPKRQKSPILTGLSVNRIKPLMTFSSVGRTARATARPPTPRPATMP